MKRSTFVTKEVEQVEILCDLCGSKDKYIYAFTDKATFRLKMNLLHRALHFMVKMFGGGRG